MQKRITVEKGTGRNTISLGQKKNNFGKWVIAIALIIAVAFSGCVEDTSTSPNTADNNAGAIHEPLLEEQRETQESGSIEKIEVYHFHGTHQCYSCITVGDYAEETINTYFADEVASGKIVFGHINGELPENQELVKKYGVTGSSLWIGVYDSGGKFSKEQNTNVWYKLGDKQEYLAYLKEVIETKLSGEMS